MLTAKMARYCKGRAQGLGRTEAGLAAGYAVGNLAPTTSGLEKRADIQAEIARLKGGGEPKQVEEESPEAWALKPSYDSPLDMFLDVMNNPKAPKGIRISCAKDAMPYCHARKEGGKKEEKAKAAKKLAGGKFATSAKPSHLKAV